MPTKTKSIKSFLMARTHPDLASLYTADMEVQVNVGQDGGERIEREFHGKPWHGWTDGIQTWKSFRIPWNASTLPEYKDSDISFDLGAHAEGIGMTGWDWRNQLSRWIAYDFDAITGHSEKHQKKLSDEELLRIKEAIFEIPWAMIRRSTGGKGLHIYVFLEPVVTKTHTEHAALGRAILGKMSAATSIDLESKVDNCGQNMWVWHRKMAGNNGLELIKSGTRLAEIPPHWRDHISVVTGHRRKNLPKFVEDIKESDAEQSFLELIGQATRVPLDSEHKALMKWLEDQQTQSWWDSDHHMYISHTYHLKEAHKALRLRGLFDTLAQGTEAGKDHNAYLCPIRRGGWVVRRYSMGAAEAPSWDQDGRGWTRCYYNTDPTLDAVARAMGGIEDTNGSFQFNEAEIARDAGIQIGAKIPEIPVSLKPMKTSIRPHKDGRIIMEIEGDENKVAASQMEGWLHKKGKWVKIFPVQATHPIEPEITLNDDLIRHIVTTSGEDFGWVIRGDTDQWRVEPLIHVQKALEASGMGLKDVKMLIGSSILKCWSLVNLPFQPEYPGNRVWNRNAAQFRFVPTQNENLEYPTWLKILNHIGKGLDDALKENPWGRMNGITTGADYLKIWIASLFKEPTQPLPYLFLYGDQNTGKSIFHEAISLLMTKGYVRADNALVNQQGFNEELSNAVLCVVEEVNLRKDKNAANRIKDFVTAINMPIHGKGKMPYHIPNTSHWVQCVPGCTWVQTDQGPKQVQDLVGHPVSLILHNQSYPTSGFFRTGNRQTFTVQTQSGHSFRATDDHRVLCEFDEVQFWKQVGELVPGDMLCLSKQTNISWTGFGTEKQGYILGLLFGDGTVETDRYHSLHGKLYFFKGDLDLIPIAKNCFSWPPNVTKERDRERYTIRHPELTQLIRSLNILPNKEISYRLEGASSDFYRGFLRGLFDTDGGVNTKNYYPQLKQSSFSRLQTVQRMLLRLGINSKIQQSGHAKKTEICGIKCDAKDSWNLYVPTQNVKLFAEKIGFNHKTKAQKLEYVLTKIKKAESFTAKVETVDVHGLEEVFDVTVPVANAFSGNGFVLHNCSNDPQYCPVLPGDTRITMVYVEPLAPIDDDGNQVLIPKKQMLQMLEKEAPDFLAEIMRIDIPPSNDRLNVPVITTAEKAETQRSNQTPLQTFLEEKCHHIPGEMVKLGELYDRFIEWADPNDAAYYTKHKFGRELPAQYPKGRSRIDGAHYVGNLSFESFKVGQTPKPPLRATPPEPKNNFVFLEPVLNKTGGPK